MSRFNDDIQKLVYIINNIYWMVQDSVYAITILAYIVNQNWYCAFGIIPSYFIISSVLKKSSKTFKAMVRCTDKLARDKNTNAGEIVTGGNSIRAFGSQEYQEQVNMDVQDKLNLCHLVNIATY